jgi:hypothetical protein
MWLLLCLKKCLRPVAIYFIQTSIIILRNVKGFQRKVERSVDVLRRNLRSADGTSILLLLQAIKKETTC